MTKQITIKLNEARFKPLLDKLLSFCGEGMSDSYSDLVGKALFYCYYSINYSNPANHGKTSFDMMVQATGKEKPELLLMFLKEYFKFKRNGLPNNHKRKG